MREDTGLKSLYHVQNLQLTGLLYNLQYRLSIYYHINTSIILSVYISHNLQRFHHLYFHMNSPDIPRVECLIVC